MKGLEIGEGGVYVTTGEKPGDLLEDAQSFGFGLASGIDQKKIVILDYSSHFDQIRENGGRLTSERS
jgi:KaiC/GvpD/RAD55 family RecA-like ATPase